MRHSLRAFFCLFLLLGLATGAPAQTWQPPTPDLGLPKPLGPHIPTPGQVADERDARIRARNEAMIAADLHQYAAQQARRDSLLEEAKQDYARIERQRREQAEFDTRFAAVNKPQYEAAYQQLAAMLTGKQATDLRRAVFVVENAYLAGQLRYADFDAVVCDLAVGCRQLAGPKATATQRFMALHRLMTDTLTLRLPGQPPYRHLPYRYDFADFRGERDYRQQFVSKLLITNSGQCHSLPLLYKLLADELGVSAYLSLAPNHCYIQVKDDHDELFSYETTNGRFVTDSYYMSTGFVKAGALKHRTYLDTLTRCETLASQVFDLAQGYENRYGRTADGFVRRCAQLGLRFYPQSATGRMLVYNSALADFTRAWQAAGQPTQEQARQQHPALQALWQAVEQARRAVEESGHEDIPPAVYAKWLREMSQEQARQSAQQAARFQQVTPR